MDYTFSSMKLNNNIVNCRICLQNSVDIQEISNFIREKIQTCFQIAISFEKSSIPLTICNICIQELDIAYSLRLKFLSLKTQLYKLFKKVREDQERTNYNDASTVFNKNLIGTNKQDEHNDTCKILSALGDNTNQKYNENGSLFQCLICKKILKTEISLQNHNISMHLKRKHLGKVMGSGSSRRYHCSKCSYSSPHSQTLVNHMRRHNGERPYHCECGKAFTQSSSLAAHRKTHSNSTFYTCSVCGKQFKHTFTLKKHQQVHESSKFSCDICKKFLKSRQSLKDHIHRHYNIKNYSCEDCGNTFVTCSELLNHRQKHSLQKKIECHLCGYKTHTKKNMVTHLKRHTGNKSFKCDLCLSSFYTNGDLLRHHRVHTKEKPFKCSTCAQSFTHSSSLNKHLNSVHGVDYKWSHIKWKGKE